MLLSVVLALACSASAAGNRAASGPKAAAVPVIAVSAVPSLPQGGAPLGGLTKLGVEITKGADLPALAAAYDNGKAGAPQAPVAGAQGSGPAPLAKSEFPVPPPQNEPPTPPESPKPGKVRAAIPSLITGLNLASGLAAALFAAHGAVFPAAALILLANVFDALDGRAARMLGVSSELGVQLDSLADVVSFGAAPALLVYAAALSPLGPLGFTAAAIYAGAGMFRLARFNVNAGKPHGDSFTGLPIPGGAGVIVALTLAAPASPALALGITLLTAAAMASTLPYPAFKKSPKLLAGAAAAAVAVSVPLAALGLWTLIPAAIFGAYLLSGPLIRVYQGSSEAFKKELKRKSFHQLLWLYVPAYLLLGHPRAGWAFAGWTGVVAAIDLIRLHALWARPFFQRWFGGIIRAKEADRMSGSFYAALGVTITTALFGGSPALVCAALACLALGDAASPLVGLRFGWKPYKVAGTQRSVDGTLAGFLVVTAIGLAFGFPPVVALGAALAFSVADTYPVKPDDNLWIPIVYASALFLLTRLTA